MQIKLLVMDVDGTMTDGKIYMGTNGELFKAFDIKDGLGIHEILPESGIKTMILTGRTSDIVLRRAEELEIDFVIQGVKNKIQRLEAELKRLGLTFEQVAYMGDDIADLECMKSCGISACPADADIKIKEIADLVVTKNGGDGAIREFVNWLTINNKGDIPSNVPLKQPTAGGACATE